MSHPFNAFDGHASFVQHNLSDEELAAHKAFHTRKMPPYRLAREKKWDFRFLRVAETIASWSKDPGTKNGTVAVNADRVILSYGYNGFPRGMADTLERLNDRDYKLDHVVHAEENCIINAGRIGVRLLGSTLYHYGLPVCHRCAVTVAQAGITRVVQFYPSSWDRPDWAESGGKTQLMFNELGIDLVTYREWEEG